MYSKEYAHQYYLEHKDKIKERVRKWGKSNPNRVKESKERWRKNHPESGKVRYWAHREEYIEKAKEYRQIEENRKVITKRSCDWWSNRTPKERKQINKGRRERYAKNPEKRRLPERIRDNRIRGNGDFREEDWNEILIKYDYRCIYCGSKDNLTIEHILPIIRGGTNDKENIAPACRKCNVKKNRMTREEFVEKCRSYLMSIGHQERMDLMI